MATDNKISELVDQYVPDFVRTQSPKLITFLKLYYKWLEQEGNPTDARYNLKNTADINETAEKFLLQFHNEFLVHIPRNIVADERLFLKHVQEFYRAKGSQKAFEILFRILYGEDIEFYIPGVDILRASDGRWIVDKSIKVTILLGVDDLLNCEGQSIIGNTSSSRARVERITKTISEGTTVYEMFLSGIINAFVVDETITCNGLTVGLINSVVEYPGRWEGTKGFLSSDKFLQDNDFYQEYSYQLKTGQFIDNYRDLVKNVCHPAGTKLFGKFVLIAQADFPVISTTAERDVEFGTETSGEIVISMDSTTLVGNILDQLILEFRLVLNIDAPSPDVEPEIATWNAPIAGTVRTANTEALSVYSANSLGDFKSWEAADFTNKKGLLGIGTNWTLDMRDVTTANLSGIAISSNNQSINAYSGNVISDFIDWKPNDFTNNKGVLGIGTSWVVDIGNTSVVLFEDQDGLDANSIHNIGIPGSDTTLLLEDPYPFNDMSNGLIHLASDTGIMILGDQDKLDANSMHIPTVPDSKVTMRMGPAYPHNDMSNGAIYLPTYV